MDKRKTIENDEQFLRQISTPVDFVKDDYKKYISELKKYCENHAVYAMAPVQIGIPKRMIYFKNTTEDMSKNMKSSYDEEIVLINPSIIGMVGHTRFLEGCESCLDFVGVIDRPYSVEVKYFDIDGEEHQEIFEGFKATVFCHEYDHLNGILHIDLTDNVMQMSMEEKIEYRSRNPQKVLSKVGKFPFADRYKL